MLKLHFSWQLNEIFHPKLCLIFQIVFIIDKDTCPDLRTLQKDVAVFSLRVNGEPIRYLGSQFSASQVSIYNKEAVATTNTLKFNVWFMSSKLSCEDQLLSITLMLLDLRKLTWWNELLKDKLIVTPAPVDFLFKKTLVEF